MITKILLFVFILSVSAAYSQNELTAVRSLKVDSLKAGLTVYFTPGYTERAEYLAEILSEAKKFFKDSLGVEYDFHLAVLDEAQ